MILSNLISSAPARWGLPFVMFGSVLGAFKVFEANTSTSFKQDLSDFILKAKYEDYLGSLPIIIQGSFDKFMGNRHLSAKSIRRSFIFTLVSTALFIVFSIVYNYNDVAAMIHGTPAFLQKSEDFFRKTSNTAWVSDFISNIKNPKLILIFIPLLWIFWCFVPDFIALLKVRIVLIVLKSINPNILSLFIVLFVDMIMTVVQFMVSIVFFQMLILYGVYSYYYDLSFDIQTASILYGMLFTLESAVLVFTGSLIVGIPFANLFWTSALPSVWLWIYIFSALFARGLVSSRSFMKTLAYVLDFKEKPVSSLGVIAGSFVCIISYMFLVVLELAKHI